MGEIEETIRVVAEMRRYDCVPLGMCENNQTNVGKKSLASGKMLLYSRLNEEKFLSHTKSFWGSPKKHKKRIQNRNLFDPRSLNHLLKQRREGLQ